jgi:hypothetical protein
MKYYHFGKHVTPVLGQNFGTSLNVRKDDGEIITIRRADLEERPDDILDNPVFSNSMTIVPALPPVLAHTPPALTSPELDSKRLELEQLLSQSNVVEEIPPAQEAIKKEDEVVTVIESVPAVADVLPVNSFTEADIPALAKLIPGLGRVTLTRLLNNRPDSGYLDIAHIKELNSSSFRWEQIELSFESKPSM